MPSRAFFVGDSRSSGPPCSDTWLRFHRPPRVIMPSLEAVTGVVPVGEVANLPRSVGVSRAWACLRRARRRRGEEEGARMRGRGGEVSGGDGEMEGEKMEKGSARHAAALHSLSRKCGHCAVVRDGPHAQRLLGRLHPRRGQDRLLLRRLLLLSLLVDLRLGRVATQRRDALGVDRGRWRRRDLRELRGARRGRIDPSKCLPGKPRAPRQVTNLR